MSRNPMPGHGGDVSSSAGPAGKAHRDDVLEASGASFPASAPVRTGPGRDRALQEIGLRPGSGGDDRAAAAKKWLS